MAQEITGFTLKAGDGAAIAAYRSLPAGRARGIVQIAHGLAEHFTRYGRLTRALTAAGWAVYGNDHRGHGASAAVHGLGHFGPGGFQAVVDDMAALSAVAKREVPGVPLVLLGHSMGSFAAQLYILDHGEALAGLVLSGTTALDLMIPSLAGRPAGLGALNAGFEPARTPFDWLSSDEAEVDAYIADPLCGFEADAASMASLFTLGSGARTDPRLRRLHGQFPILVISGQVDPVVGPGQAFARALIQSYEAAGLGPVTHRVYVGGRHEMFNETCRAAVEGDLIAWLDGIAPQGHSR
jgi:alpha-beta hydrolase superfamily lysophospholipase